MLALQLAIQLYRFGNFYRRLLCSSLRTIMDLIELQDPEGDVADDARSPDLMAAYRNLLDLQSGMGMLPIMPCYSLPSSEFTGDVAGFEGDDDEEGFVRFEEMDAVVVCCRLRWVSGGPDVVRVRSSNVHGFSLNLEGDVLPVGNGLLPWSEMGHCHGRKWKGGTDRR
ncbi:hypothetical protein ACLOJK_040629 [Asimina triloba]